MNANRLQPLALDDPRFTLVDGRTRPEFMLVGGMKCGSTSFARYLSAHPQVKTSLATLPLANAVRNICALVDAFDGNVWIVSKAGARTESLTRRWLGARNFFGETGLEEDHLRFCRERSDKQPICSELGVTHFVDDRVHIM